VTVEPGHAAVRCVNPTTGGDVMPTLRDWQFRTREWRQGKTWEATTPFGPVLVTPDELAGGVAPALQLTASSNGEVVQKTTTADLVLSPVDLVRYASTVLTLRPRRRDRHRNAGRVGHARTPVRFLRPGSRLVTEVDRIGGLPG